MNSFQTVHTIETGVKQWRNLQALGKVKACIDQQVREVAAILDIAEDTVNWRLKHAYVKLNAVNKVQAVVNAIRMKEIRL